MGKKVRRTILAIHQDARYLGRLADEIRRDGRFHWAGGYALATQVLVSHRKQPAMVAMVCSKADEKGGVSMAEVRLLAQLWPRMQLLVLGEDRNLAMLLEAVDAGAIGYLPRSTAPRALMDAVDSVILGESVIHGGSLRLLVEHLRSARNSTREGPYLGRTETRILAHLSTGATQKETAEVLGLAYQTVRNLCQQIYRKLDVTSEREAVLWFSRHQR
ncbi:MAG: response regulator transcription factor [Verrucomicrobiales bacterium]|nr:response regulator transcription factor [Verrucomicrobiales bacterium]